MKRILSLLLVFILLAMSTGCGTVKIYIGEDANNSIEETMQSSSSDEASVSNELDNEETEHSNGDIFDEAPSELITPTIEYEDKVFTTHMVLEQEDMEYLKMTCFFGARSWGNILDLVEESGYELDSGGKEIDDRVLTVMQIEEEGASCNGISVGDSYTKVFEKFPMATLSVEASMNLTNYYGTTTEPSNFVNEEWDPTYGAYELFVYVHDGKAYSRDEYIDNFLWRGTELPEDYLYRKDRCAFDTYVLMFFMGGGEVRSIMVGNCVGAVNGQ